MIERYISKDCNISNPKCSFPLQLVTSLIFLFVSLLTYRWHTWLRSKWSLHSATCWQWRTPRSFRWFSMASAISSRWQMMRPKRLLTSLRNVEVSSVCWCFIMFKCIKSGVHVRSTGVKMFFFFVCQVWKKWSNCRIMKMKISTNWHMKLLINSSHLTM